MEGSFGLAARLRLARAFKAVRSSNPCRHVLAFRGGSQREQHQAGCVRSADFSPFECAKLGWLDASVIGPGF